jgi:hypothetical protein
VVKVHFAVLIHNAEKASAWETSKDVALVDLAWAEQQGLPALAVVKLDGEVVEVHATSHVDAQAVKAELDVE